MVTRGRSLAARIRLWILGALLLSTIVGGAFELHARHARREWQQPLRVSVALVQMGAIDPAALATLRGRFPVLEARLASEYERYGGRLVRPVRFSVFAPVTIDQPAPADPDGSLLDLARRAYEQWRWTRAVDLGSGIASGEFDSRIYLVMSAPRDEQRNFVEGTSEQGGRVGFARIELGKASVDLGLFVVAHELFHTLGANDKYDAAGRAVIPAGLVEPNRVPLYPQRFADVMTRNVVLGPGAERPPDTLSELGVGLETAREIGWSSSEPSK